MADVLGVPASVAGLLSLGIQVIGGLIEYYKTYNDLENTTSRTNSRLRNLSPILRQVEETIQRRSFEGEEDVVAKIVGCIEDCEESIHELHHELEKFQYVPSSDFRSKIGVAKQRLLYPFRESTLLKLDEDIGDIRGNISVALEVLGLRSQEAIQNRLSDVQSVVRLIRSDQISEKIRTWLNAPDMTSEHNALRDKRHLGTGTWLTQGSKFQDWLIQDNSFLWLSGFAGSGKSVLCSTAIEFVHDRKQKQKNVGVAFYYFTFREEQRRDELAMLRVLLLQLASQLSNGESLLERFYESSQGGTPSAESLIYHIRYMVSEFSHVYVLIDALDESSRYTQRCNVMKTIQKIQERSPAGLHLLCTSRNEEDIRESIQRLNGQEIVLKNAQIDEDIREYIRGQLNKDEVLQLWHRHHDRIEETLTGRAEGIFRWVECQLKTLRACPRSERRLNICLNSLPRGLDETYERMLCSIPEESIEDARRMLQLLCFSVRPLTVAEITEGIAVSLTDPIGVHHGDVFEDWQSLETICPGLVDFYPRPSDCALDKIPQSVKVRIAHFSVQEYLVSPRIKQQKAFSFALEDADAHAEIAQICGIYLQEPGLSSEILSPPVLDEHPLASFSAEFWIHHYKRARDPSMELHSQVLDIFQSLPSAFQSWIRLSDPEAAYRLQNLERKTSEIPSPIYYASLLGLTSVLKQLLISQKDPKRACMVGANGGHHSSPLGAAAFAGHEEAVQVLLENGADVNAVSKFGVYATPLQAASAEGHAKVVRMLLDWGANVHTVDRGYGSALQAASSRGTKEVVQILLEHGANLHADGYIYYGNALITASAHGQEEIVRFLLAKGANVNAQDVRKERRYQNALEAASSEGHEQIVQVLLNNGAEVNLLRGYTGNALIAASVSGHAKVVQKLLAAGANVDTHSNMFGNALIAASVRGDEETVEMIVQAGANVNASDKSYGSPLQVASSQGHVGIVKVLLARNAEVNTRSGPGTPLQLASEGGYENIVQMLLWKGAKIDIRGVEGTALQRAAKMGRPGIVQMLLDHGANANEVEGLEGMSLVEGSRGNVQLVA